MQAIARRRMPSKCGSCWKEGSGHPRSVNRSIGVWHGGPFSLDFFWKWGLGICQQKKPAKLNSRKLIVTGGNEKEHHLNQTFIHFFQCEFWGVETKRLTPSIWWLEFGLYIWWAEPWETPQQKISLLRNPFFNLFGAAGSDMSSDQGAPGYLLYTLPTFNSSTLKRYNIPIGKESSSSPTIFQGWAVQLRGVYCGLYQAVYSQGSL